MPKNIPGDSSEIDLLGIILTIWENRLKVFLISALLVIFLFILETTELLSGNKSYIATTEIRPISTSNELEYSSYNIYSLSKDFSIRVNNKVETKDDTTKEQALLLNEIKKKMNEENELLGFSSIDKDLLLKLFIDKLKENKNFEEGIKKFNIISKENYKNSQKYEDDVKKLASTIKFLPPNDDIKKGKIEMYWRIQFEVENPHLWQKILKSINDPVNELIRLHINNRHNTFIKNKKNLRKFQIEDIELIMKNSMINYENITDEKLAYLEEQAKIARKLGLASNNYLEPTSVNTGSTLVTTLIAKTPDYLKGYEMIEEEILLIKTRVNKKAFIKNFSLLEDIKRTISTNKDIERLEDLFQSTPAYDPNKFYAAKIMYQSTIYDGEERNRTKMIILFIIIGLMVGSLYVLIEKAIKRRKKL